MTHPDWSYDGGHTNRSKRYLYEILVPCQWNDGRPVRTRHHREWDKRVRAISGGLTIMHPARGQWIHEDALYIDRVIPVRVLCYDVEMDEIARITIEHYEQEAVLFYVVANSAKVLHATEAQREKFTHKRTEEA